MQSRTSSFAVPHAQPITPALVPSERHRHHLGIWSGWRGPTVVELADRVEHQFGELPALAGVHSLGFASDEPLTPCDIREVCDLLGVPAVDLGLDV